MKKQFKLPEAAVGSVTLKVKKLDQMTEYYESIGLSKLTESSDEVVLGIEQTNQSLLILKRAAEPSTRRKTTGLFHTAFLVPDRRTLGNVLFHLLSHSIPISGASDHGYSEALYLTDPEGNGIEIYRDKPEDDWDKRPNGRIAGVTVEMDAEGVLASRDEQPEERFPAGTKIGHIHLSVSNLDDTQTFYESVLGFDLTDQFGEQARFFAANGYHHHIGTNVWMGTNLPAPENTDIGLEQFTILVPSKRALEEVKAQLQSKNNNLLFEEQNKIAVMDPNGIKVLISVNRQTS